MICIGCAAYINSALPRTITSIRSMTDDPDKCGARHNGKNTEYGVKQILIGNSLADPCDAPYDVECGEAEDDLEDRRQTVKRINDFVHSAMNSSIYFILL